MYRCYLKKLYICLTALFFLFVSVIPVSAEDGDLVYVDVPLTWYADYLINYDTGYEEPDDSCSITGFLKVIEGARYDIIFSYNAQYAPVNTTVAFYYNAYQDYLGYEGVWVDSTSYDHFVTLHLPSNCSYIRLSNDLQQTSDNQQQQQVRLRIYVQASYIEEHDVVAETLQDVVYRDDSSVISDSADKFTEEYDKLHREEEYLVEQSDQVFNDYFASTPLDRYLNDFSNAFEFIGTWFFNFMHAHEAFYTMIAVSMGLVVLFILIRFRGS